MIPPTEPGLAASALRLIRFGIVGALASATYAVLVVTLVNGFGVGATPAGVAAYILAIPVSFLGQKHFTFASKDRVRRELPGFLGVQALNLAAATAIMHVVTARLGLSHLLGIAAVVVVVPVLAYALLALSVFRSPRP